MVEEEKAVHTSYPLAHQQDDEFEVCTEAYDEWVL